MNLSALFLLPFVRSPKGVPLTFFVEPDKKMAKDWC